MISTICPNDQRSSHMMFSHCSNTVPFTLLFCFVPPPFVIVDYSGAFRAVHPSVHPSISFAQRFCSALLFVLTRSCVSAFHFIAHIIIGE
jgi:hypothetical protein